MKRLSMARKVSIGAMVVALNLVMLYLASVLPAGRLACYFVCSLFIYVLAGEKAYPMAIGAMLATALLGYIILPSKNTLIPYVVLIGHYGIFKSFIDAAVPDRLIRFGVKLLYSNVFVTLGVYFCYAVLKIDMTALLPKMALWIFVILAEVGFVAFDLLYQVCQNIYEVRLRRAIIPKK